MDTAGITSGKKRLLTLDFELDAAIHEANLFTTGSHATNTHTSGGKKNAVIHRGYHWGGRGLQDALARLKDTHR